MNAILFSEEFCQPEKLHPFTLTRQLQDIRIGILTIREKWEKMLRLVSYDKKEDDYKDLSRSITPEALTRKGDCFQINGNVLPTGELVSLLKKLKNGDCITTPAGHTLAFRFGKKEIIDQNKIRIKKSVVYTGELLTIQYPWDIIRLNEQALLADFALLTARRKSQPLSKTNKQIKPARIFVEKGAVVEHAVINAENGPVYIGKNAVIMEGCLIRGPLALGTAAVLKMGTRVYGATTIGPGCVAGGEIKNSVLFGFSNKAHDGYLGDSVIGEWCNLGAGTSNSNVKNTAAAIKVWTREGEQDAGQKCGVMMGDYTRTAINTSVNTGTVIGACCNVFGAGLTPRYIPSFSWGSDGLTRYRFEKVLADIENWKKLKNCTLSGDEKIILKSIFDKF